MGWPAVKDAALDRHDLDALLAVLLLQHGAFDAAIDDADAHALAGGAGVAKQALGRQPGEDFVEDIAQAARQERRGGSSISGSPSPRTR